jgi:16S rRNA (adenine1518-N6/adenine1519-N6)-dimethyltransferase
VGQRLGQHFLKDATLLQRIAEAVCPEREPLVVEIGPGRGALTRHLIGRAERVVAVETDPRLVEHLQEEFRGAENLIVIHGDVLKTGLGQWGTPVVAGNLPYYITSPILRLTLALGDNWRRAVYLVQKEVAERLVAQPGSRSYGFLTVQTGVAAHAEILFEVPARAFRPAPKVDSALVRLTPRGAAAPDTEEFLEFVSRCFRQKRKTLRNNLAGWLGRAVLEGDPELSLRAEQLDLPRFRALYERLRDAR